MTKLTCRLCGSSTVELLIDFGEQPIVHHLKRSAEEPVKGYPFTLGHCASCDFLQLTNPIAPEILYENYLTFSQWKNQPHVDRLIQVLRSFTQLGPESRLLEIGCNDGSFLNSLREQGITNCVGVEPANDVYQLARAKGLRVLNSFFGPSMLYQLEGSYDVIITRQVLEHIVDLHGFLNALSTVMKPDAMLVIEIPDSQWQIETLDYGLWEEHVNLFTLNTLEQLLKRHNLSIIHHEITLFSGRALTVFVEKRQKPITGLLPRGGDGAIIQRYQEGFPILRNALQAMVSEQKKAMVYGCGARSATVVNHLGLTGVAGFVDDQAEKQGFFAPGCNLPISAWSEEIADAFFLFGVNTENEGKVIERRGLKPGQYCSILPPSRYLPDAWKALIQG